MEHKIVKGLKAIISILVVVLIGAIIWKFSALVDIPNNLDVFRKPNADKINRFKTSTKQFGNTFYIEYKELKGGAANPGGKVYFNLDITVETESDALMLKLRSNQRYTVEIIRSVVGGFTKEELDTQQGKEYLKRQVIAKLSEVYNTNEIKAVYLEKFMYEYK